MKFFFLLLTRPAQILLLPLTHRIRLKAWLDRSVTALLHLYKNLYKSGPEDSISDVHH